MRDEWIDSSSLGSLPPTRIPSARLMKTGVLLVQLGTPDAPTARRCGPICVNSSATRASSRSPGSSGGSSLTCSSCRAGPGSRPPSTGASGTPRPARRLLHWTRRQTEALQQPAARDAGPLRHADRQSRRRRGGRPRLIREGVDRLIVLPMYPQYSATTTASATDALFQALHEGTAGAGLADCAALLRASRLPRCGGRRHPRRPGQAGLAAGPLPAELSRHPDQVRPARATRTPRTSSARRARLVERLGWPAGTLDADVPIAVRPGHVG